MSRPCHCRRVAALPKDTLFLPQGKSAEELQLGLDGLEALRLADYEGLAMDEASRIMGVSRHTFGRVLRRARHVVACALVEGQGLRIGGGVCVEQTQGEKRMSDSIMVAVPSDEPGGLNAAPSAHFGHCAVYTVARVQNGVIDDVKVEPNRGHEHGGCVEPVRELAKMGVRALLAGGMGMRPLAAMQDAGIEVYYATGFKTVKDALDAFAAGKLTAFGSDNLCKGSCGHHEIGGRH